MENYVLLKDMPDAKAGTIFTPDIFENPFYTYTTIYNEPSGINKKSIEKNPNWFMKVSEYDKQKKNKSRPLTNSEIKFCTRTCAEICNVLGMADDELKLKSKPQLEQELLNVTAERNVYKELYNKHILHPKTEQQQTTELSDFTKMIISENAELNKELERYKNVYNDIVEKHNEKNIDARSRYDRALKAVHNHSKQSLDASNTNNFFLPQPLLEEILKMAAGL